MKEEHFYKIDANDNPYLIHKRLSKEDNWITNETVKGKLTEEGIKYVESKISKKAESHLKPIWDKN